MVTKIETPHPGEFMVSEASGFRSRERVTLMESQTVIPGQVLGRQTRGPAANMSAVAAADAGNTGDGTLTLADPAVADGAKSGVYRVTCIEAAANGGGFEVEGPDGVALDIATVGVAFDGAVKFTIADGATDFAVGDVFTVTVSIDASKACGALDLVAVDGLEQAAGIAFYGATTGVGETADIAAIVRDAEVRASDLTWPDGITADQKTAAIAELSALGIILR